MIIRLHHAQITVPKDGEAQAREFYCGFLGLQEIPRPESLKTRGGFWVELDRTQIHVSVEDGVDRNLTKAHLAYQVANLEEWRERLLEKNIHTLMGVDVPGLTRFEFRDPFGNRVEFIQAL